MLGAMLALVVSAHPLPPTFGFEAVQCVRVREVVCVADADYSVTACMMDVPVAVRIINRAVGRRILHFAGIITPQGLPHARETGALIVMGWPEQPVPGGLAVTHPEVALQDGWPCIVWAAVILDSRSARRQNSPYDPLRVIVHEFIHALGAAHASEESSFRSRMAPVYDKDMRAILSPADVLTLRVTYGRKK